MWPERVWRHVAARMALDDGISAGQAEDLADDIDRRLVKKLR